MNAVIGFSATNSGSIMPALSAEIAADTLVFARFRGAQAATDDYFH
jgi:hypothetical protein